MVVLQSELNTYLCAEVLSDFYVCKDHFDNDDHWHLEKRKETEQQSIFI